MKQLTNLILTFSLLNSVNAFAGNYTKQDLNVSKAKQSASIGGVATGGGDHCEDRIKIIRDDLKAWILKGGSKRLQLPDGISDGVYADDMLEQIFSAKIRCVGNGDAGYPVAVNETPKVCRFDRSSSSSLITCDYKKFELMSESDQYALIHHEYAGLADIEKPNGSDSDYRVSNQITQNLEIVTMKRLAVRNSLSMQDIPKDKLEGYVAAAARSLKDLSDSVNRQEVPQLCKTRAFETVETKCGFNIPDDFDSGLSFYEAGRIAKKGNVTVMEFDISLSGSEKRSMRITYDQQKIRSVELSIYKWEFPKAADVSNPPTKKEWVKEGSTTWFRK